MILIVRNKLWKAANMKSMWGKAEEQLQKQRLSMGQQLFGYNIWPTLVFRKL